MPKFEVIIIYEVEAEDRAMAVNFVEQGFFEPDYIEAQEVIE